MARLPADRLSDPSGLLQGPVLGDAGVDTPIRAIVEVIRQADSQQSRQRLMNDIAFPSSDVRMFLVVSHLALFGPLRPSELADRIETGAANMTKIVGRLEAAGLVGRMPDPEDGRSVIVALTPTGAEIGERLVAHHRADMIAWSEKWSDDEVTLFLRMLDDFSGLAGGGTVLE